jgi:hypothetical protein
MILNLQNSIVFDNIDLDFVSTNNNITYFTQILNADDFLTQNQIAVYNEFLNSNTNINYLNYFYIFSTYENLNVHELTDNNELISNINELSTTSNLLVKYENKICLSLFDYLNSCKTKSIYYSKLFTIYKQLLQSLNLLDELKIVHNNLFNFNTSNIIVDINLEKPLIMKFNLSLCLNNITNIELHLKQIFKIYKPEYVFWPIEIHILCYLFYKLEPNSSLSKFNIYNIVNDVYNNSNFINLFGQSISNKFIEEAKEYCSKYINMKYTNIIDEIIKCSSSWDLFSTSCYFYHLINLTNKKTNLFVKMFLKMLLVCLQPNYNKRLSINQCLVNFDKILNNININVFYSLIK